jgi:hypothetical protein
MIVVSHSEAINQAAFANSRLVVDAPGTFLLRLGRGVREYRRWRVPVRPRSGNEEGCEIR